ncbi:MAG: hypothetical protein HY899_02320 [Deltaproteobacteria bacterium]|nr:hypothetical protein [Deltaproteobacteria bacterium]
MKAFQAPGYTSRYGHRAAAAALIAAAILLMVPPPVGATFHLAHISRVMTGVGGTTDVQFVEIVMDAIGQHLVAGSKLIAFKTDGTFDHVVLSVPSNSIASGSGRPWIMASAAFAAEAGITPDFVFDSTGVNGLIPEDGMVCWGKPGDQTNPNSAGMIDCVSYGNFTGPPNVHTSAPSTLTPFGRGLVRISSTASSAEDFVCEDPAVPRNNAQAAGQIDATAPCTGCGNGVVDSPETCDDGDTAFLPGDFCSADCAVFSCGVPTKIDAAEPRTSDALFVLKAAVQASNCDARVCDVNDSGSVTASDALVILKRAVGQPVELNCPG